MMSKNRLFKASLLACAILTACCRNDARNEGADSLEHQLLEIVNHSPGTVGVAFVSDNDTVLINNGVRYAMMSVVKLHQSLAVCSKLALSVTSPDSVLHVSASELDPHTWSPMLKDYSADGFDISVGELVRYAIVSSDNNASNILFDRIASPESTDAFIRSVAADSTFSIACTEADMKADNARSYDNYTSPLAACLLIRQVFTTDFDGLPGIDAVRLNLAEVTTGHDRIGAPVAGEEGLLFAHKTGSGYRNSRGELMAFNDVAYIRMPDGRDYGLAVMIRDFDGSEENAAAIMAAISEAVYNHLMRQQPE